MRIFQSLWTKPAINKSPEKLRDMLYIYALSLIYGLENHYTMVLYTDSLGMEIMKNFPYNEKHLLNIPEDNSCKCFKAQSKFYALQQEPLGSIHIDGDVFLKQPSIFMNLNNADVIVQNSETYQFDNDVIFFKEGADWLYENGVTPDLRTYNGTYNCGTIGFFNQELKDQYLNNYFSALEKLKNKEFDFWLDLILEQQMLFEITKDKYKVFKLFTDDSTFDALLAQQNALGYTHLIGTQKQSKLCMQDVKRILRKKNRDLYTYILNLDLQSLLK